MVFWLFQRYKTRAHREYPGLKPRFHKIMQCSQKGGVPILAPLQHLYNWCRDKLLIRWSVQMQNQSIRYFQARCFLLGGLQKFLIRKCTFKFVGTLFSIFLRILQEPLRRRLFQFWFKVICPINNGRRRFWLIPQKTGDPVRPLPKFRVQPNCFSVIQNGCFILP